MNYTEKHVSNKASDLNSGLHRPLGMPGRNTGHSSSTKLLGEKIRQTEEMKKKIRQTDMSKWGQHQVSGKLDEISNHSNK